MAWQEILISSAAAGIGALAGGYFTLYVKDKAGDVSRRTFQEEIKGALATFQNDLITKLNGTYVRSGECGLRESAIGRRLDTVEREVTHPEGYVRRNKHGVANELQKIIGRLDALEER